MIDNIIDNRYLKIGITTQELEVRFQQERNKWDAGRYTFDYHNDFKNFPSVQDAKKHEEAIKWRLRNFLPENLCDINGKRRTEYFIDNNKEASEICDKYLYENTIITDEPDER